jgi:hypothetical protein
MLRRISPYHFRDGGIRQLNLEFSADDTVFRVISEAYDSDQKPRSSLQFRDPSVHR